MIDAGHSSGVWSSTSIADRNAYYKTTIIQDDKNDLYFPDAKQSNNNELCFVQRRLTDVEKICIPYAVTHDDGPHLNQCDVSNTALRSDIGVDNRKLDKYIRYSTLFKTNSFY